MVKGQGGQPFPEKPYLRHADSLRRRHRRLGARPRAPREVETPPHELHQPLARHPARHTHHLPARQPRRLSGPHPAPAVRQRQRPEGVRLHERRQTLLRAARRHLRPRHLVDEVARQGGRRGLLGAHVVQPPLQPAKAPPRAALLLDLAADQAEGQGLGLLHQRLRAAPGTGRRAEGLLGGHLRAHPSGRQAHDRRHPLPELGRLGRIADGPRRGLRRQLGDSPLRGGKTNG